MTFDLSIYGTFAELVIQLAVVVIAASAIGFLIARWFYRTDRSAHTEVLQQEIMRLRRRVADGDRQAGSLQRMNDRTKRHSKRVTELEGLGI